MGRHWKGFVKNGRLQSEVYRLFISALWFGGCAFAMAMVQINGDALHARHVRGPLTVSLPTATQGSLAIPTIHDVVFDNLPMISSTSIFNPDFFLHSFIIVSLIASLFHWSPVVLLARARRYFWLYGAGYFLRMCSLAGTVLPPSNPACVPQIRSWWETVKMTPLLLIGRTNTCTDKLFSGHTTVATLLLWFWLDARSVAGDRIVSFWRIYAIFHFFGMITTSILGHNHYTVDIVLAFIINTLTYTCYKYGLIIGQYQHQANTTELTSDELKTVARRFIRLLYWCDGADIAPVMEPIQDMDIV